MVECKIGLDIISFIVRIEECFGITISDEDAEKVATVGDLFSYVRAKLAAGPSTQCLTAKAFYYLRRMLIEDYGCKQERIIPRMPLGELFPEDTRRQQLARLGRSLRVSLPRYMPAASRYLTIELLWLLPAASVICVLCNAHTAGIVIAVATLPAIMAWHLAKLQGRYQTVGDLAPVILEQHFKEFTGQGASDQQIWESITAILCSEAGMKRSDVTGDLRFLDIPGDL